MKIDDEFRVATHRDSKSPRELEQALGLPPGYILGLGRDVPHPRIAHIYQGDYHNPGLPMCARGFNREGGTSYSIWRGLEGTQGVCRICFRRAKAGKDGRLPQ